VALSNAYWEEDDFPGAAADIGYDEFADSVWWAVRQIIDARSLASMEPTPAELAALTAAVNADVRRAIERYLRGRFWIGNPDDVIGFDLLRFSHDSFSTSAFQPFSVRWSGSDGDWVLSGSITGVPPCPVSALFAALGPRAAEVPGAEDLQAAMRTFRDMVFANNSQAAALWSVLEDNSATLASAVNRDPELQELALELLRSTRSLLDDAGTRIGTDTVRRAETLLRRLGDGAPRSRKQLAALRPLLARMEGKTLMELAASLGQSAAD
jgi:hypothetical protein